MFLVVVALQSDVYADTGSGAPLYRRATATYRQVQEKGGAQLRTSQRTAIDKNHAQLNTVPKQDCVFTVPNSCERQPVLLTLPLDEWQMVVRKL